ncbi:hypothetical protein RQP46_007608 [Phenoliferia psychrophenolica]
MLVRTVILISSFSAFALGAPTAQPSDTATSGSPTTTIKNGTYQGIYLEPFKQDAYLGMRFAQAPVGELRFRHPQSLNATWSGAANATEYGLGCAAAEDCLTINVVKPSAAAANLPVLVWNFGGGFVGGYSGDAAFNGSYLVQKSVELEKPIIFVSYNSGGFSVHSQAAAYGGRDDGLFRGLIIDSGLMAFQNWTVESQTSGYDAIVASANCTTAMDQLACLRAMPIAAFRTAAATGYSGVYYPVPDGNFFQEPIMKAYQKGAFVKVPAILGATIDDGTSGFLAPTGLNNDTAFQAALFDSFKLFALTTSNATIASFMDAYPNDPALGAPINSGEGVVSSGLQDKRSFAIFNDMVHGATRYATARRAAFQPDSVFSYRFAQLPQNQTMDAGVTHGSELAYVFGIQDRDSVAAAGGSYLGTRASDNTLSAEIMLAWINFVNNGNPNPSEEERFWPPYGRKALNFVWKSNASHVDRDDYREHTIDLKIKLGLGQL